MNKPTVNSPGLFSSDDGCGTGDTAGCSSAAQALADNGVSMAPADNSGAPYTQPWANRGDGLHILPD